MSELSDTTGLKSLGSGVSYRFEYDPSLLERFPNPYKKRKLTGSVVLRNHHDEFTSLCPMTGQPDFGKIHVRYTPDDWCVESKSWKLYLFSFRNHQDFHEACCAQIAADLIALLNPVDLEVWGEFTPRGGISIEPKVTWVRDA